MQQRNHKANRAAYPARGTSSPRESDSTGPWRLAERIVLLCFAVLVAAALIYVLRAIVLDVIVALILATGLRPLVGLLRRFKVPSGLAVLLIYFTFVAMLFAFGMAVVPPLLGQLDNLVRHAPEYGNSIAQALITRFPFLSGMDNQFDDQMRNLGSQIGVLAGQVLKLVDLLLGVFNGLLSLVFILFLTYYFIVDGGRIRNYGLSFVAPPRRELLVRLTDRIGVRLGRWLIGELTICATVGFAAYLGLTLIGIPGALLLGLVAAVGEFIPNVGPFLSAIPAALVAMTQSPIQLLLVLGLFVLIHQLDFLLIVPKIMQHVVRIHPLAVILALLIGGTLLGIPGALVAVPVATAVAVILDEFRYAPIAVTPDVESAHSSPEAKIPVTAKASDQQHTDG